MIAAPEQEFVNIYGAQESIPAACVCVTWRAGTITPFVVPARQAGWIDSLESIPGLLKRLQIRALANFNVSIFLSSSAYRLIALYDASIL